MDRAAKLISSLALGLAAFLPPTDYAHASAPAIASAPVPADTISCVVDAVPKDDREIIMLLMVSAIAKSSEIEREDDFKEVGTILEAGEEICASNWHWNDGTKFAARNYAEIEFLRQVYVQILMIAGRNVGDIDDYFSANKETLGSAYVLSSRHYDALDKVLIEKGWEDNELLDFSHIYFDMIWEQERSIRRFNRSHQSKLKPAP